MPWMEQKPHLSHLSWDGAGHKSTLLPSQDKRQDARGEAVGVRISVFVLGNER